MRTPIRLPNEEEEPVIEEEEEKTKRRTRSTTLENVMGNLMVAQYHVDAIRKKLNNIFFQNDTADPYIESKRFIKLADDIPGWYRVTVRLDKILNIQHVDPTLKPEDETDARHNLENLVGQMLVADYQVYQLKKRVAYTMLTEPGSSFMFKSEGKWFSADIDVYTEPAEMKRGK